MAVFQNARRIARLAVIGGPPIVLAVVASWFGMWAGAVGAVVVLAIGIWIGAAALYTSRLEGSQTTPEAPVRAWGREGKSRLGTG